MNKLTASDVRRMLDDLDAIEELINVLRHNHFTVPYAPISRAIAARIGIRNTLLRSALVDVEVETKEAA